MERVVDLARLAAAVLWGAAACVFIYVEWSMPTVIERAAGCVRAL